MLKLTIEESLTGPLAHPPTRRGRCQDSRRKGMQRQRRSTITRKGGQKCQDSSTS
jgi:hypothetical protein